MIPVRVLLVRIPVLLYPTSQTFIRSFSSTSPILAKSLLKNFVGSKIKSKNKNKNKNKKKKEYIIEEPTIYQNETIQKYYNGISPYLVEEESSDLTNELKVKMMSTKIEELLNNVEEIEGNDELIEVLELSIKNGFKDINNNNRTNIPIELSILLFDKLYNEIIIKQPGFSKQIIESLLLNIEKLPNLTIIQLVTYIQDSKSSKLNQILKSLLNRINFDSFLKDYLEYLYEKKKLSLEIFEELIELEMIKDDMIKYLNKHIEDLFKETTPEVHCYLNLEYNIDRIQYVINQMINKLQFSGISLDSLLTIFKLNWEILQVNKCQESSDNNDKILNYLQDKTNQVKDEIFRQNLDDESLAECLLFTSWKYNNKMLANEITEFISKDEVKFSQMLRYQSEVYKIVHNSLSNNVVEQIIAKLPEHMENPSEVYEKSIQAIMTSDISPTSEIIDQLQIQLSTEKSIYSYKYLLDRAIEMNDYEVSMKIFNASVSDFTPWAQYNTDPTISKTINDLIQCVVNNNPMKQAFPIFQSIKAQLQQQINIDTINSIVPKILQEDLTGDVIELMTRELPKMEQEQPDKFPIDKPFGYKYYKLYDMIHTYCITNTNDSRMVNNWYLYVHCYNYFFIPHERLLPTMKFFCENQRWNAALRIFRSSLELSKLHGEHNHKPPSREMYLYLINEFGDKLYEEGIIEIHESLKMDLTLDYQDRELIHSIMNAYCNLQEVSKVRDLFLTMSLNPKDEGGVDETSAMLMIKAYTYHDLMYVEKFWNNLTTFGLIPDYKLLKQYLIAYSYHGLIDKSIEIVENIEQDYDLELNDDLLINMYNYCYEIQGQQKLQNWATKNHPEIWNNIVKSGKLIQASGYKPNENFLVDGSTNDPKRLNEPIFK
ncbi:conserved hypothetical protein [Candida tropicalis MYA-3404]|uniref:Mitochondrial group I intron splicing factor CCM1 n=1 Tax=Candida tropicalis (strain ATCC MYA-3404 / T1) TaxID=294747 RepID=C5M7P1_CANTT|nr:conserved hypothetical protein [Candida tropicalis MYA-3404]EER35011.1 conserved hypothetical protein [Candida tropicalis MYA-3404]KAG4408896.1 hypothetical protein JTP64_002202 [Candida tropicalis]